MKRGKHEHVGAAEQLAFRITFDEAREGDRRANALRVRAKLAHVGGRSIARDHEPRVRHATLNPGPRVEQELHALHGMQAREEEHRARIRGFSYVGGRCAFEPRRWNHVRARPPLDSLPRRLGALHRSGEVHSGCALEIRAVEERAIESLQRAAPVREGVAGHCAEGPNHDGPPLTHARARGE